VYELYFSTPDYLSIGTAAWAAPVSPLHRSALLGQSLAWRPARSRDFLLILMRVRLGRLAAAPTQPPAVASSLQVFMTRKEQYLISGFVRYAAINSKKTNRCGILHLSRTMLEKRGQKGKFFRRQKFALLLTPKGINKFCQKNHFIIT